MSPATGKTIQIYLPYGEARGIRIGEITTRIVQAVLIPRTLLGKAKARPELKRVAVYLLLGESEESAKPIVYVGQTENPGKRLDQHTGDEAKAFWQTAVVFVSKTNSFTQTHVRYLEYHCQTRARDAGRYSLHNKLEAEPHVTEPIMADLLDTFETMSVLVSALGFPVFDPMPKAVEKDVFYCKGVDAEGRGRYVEDGFVVFAGSVVRPDIVASARETVAARDRLFSSNILAKLEGKTVFQEDYQFRSPSGAATMVLGRRANGWVEWKTEDGKTLDELKRVQDDGVEDGAGDSDPQPERASG